MIGALEKDTHSPGELQHIWMLLVEHKDVYHPYSVSLIPWLVQSPRR